MTITTFKQSFMTLPDGSVRVTEVSQDVIMQDFSKWLDELERLASQEDHIISIAAYRTLKKYHKKGLTPIQAFKKIIL